jgi:hypothetical protein
MDLFIDLADLSSTASKNAINRGEQMKKSEDADLEGKSGLFLGSEPLEDVRHRRSYKLAGDDSDKKDAADGDAGDDDATDSDTADSDLTDAKDEDDDSGDSDGKD